MHYLSNAALLVLPWIVSAVAQRGGLVRTRSGSQTARCYGGSIRKSRPKSWQCLIGIVSRNNLRLASIRVRLLFAIMLPSPDHGQAFSTCGRRLSRKDLAELQRPLSMMSQTAVEDFYRSSHGLSDWAWAFSQR